MAGRSASRVAYDDASSSNRDAYLQRIIDHVGTGDAALILRRIVALVAAGESGVSIAARLNGPARPQRPASELMLTIAEPEPSRATLSIVRPRPRTDVEAAAQARLDREMVRVGAKPKTPPAERPPKPAPEKERPVRRAPAPQRKGAAIRKGTLAAPTRDVDGQKVQTIRCACGTVYERPYRTGRLPGVCETCR